MANFKSVEAALKYFNTKYGHDPRYYWNSLSNNEKRNVTKASFGYKKEVSFDELKKAINDRLFNENGKIKHKNYIKKAYNKSPERYDALQKAYKNNKKLDKEIKSKKLQTNSDEYELLGDKFLLENDFSDADSDINFLNEDLLSSLSDKSKNSLLDVESSGKINKNNPLYESILNRATKFLPNKWKNNQIEEKDISKIFAYKNNIDPTITKKLLESGVNPEYFATIKVMDELDKNYTKDDLIPYLDDYVNNSPDKNYLENSTIEDVLDNFYDELISLGFK